LFVVIISRNWIDFTQCLRAVKSRDGFDSVIFFKAGMAGWAFVPNYPIAV
jgi:hypothetical protein